MGRIQLLLVFIVPVLILTGCTDGIVDDESQRINSNVTSLLYDEASDQMFIGTEDNGLFIYSPSEDSWIHRTTENGLPSITINTIAYNQVTNELYMGFSKVGYSIFQLDKDEITNYNKDNTIEMGEGLPTDNIWAISFDPVSSNMIIGSIRDISLFNPKELTFTNFNASDQPLEGLKTIRSFYLDKQNRILYIGTTHNALWSFNLENHIFVNYDISPHEIVALVHNPSSQMLYIGSVKLRIMDLSTNSIAERTTEHGLPSDVIQALALDPDSNTLYIGTNNGPGLTIYDIDNDSFRIIE